MDLIKEYSTLDEVLEFLKFSNEYDYSLDDIYELEIEGKINIFLYLESVRQRRETKDINGNITYEFENINIKAIYRKDFKGTMLSKSSALDYSDYTVSPSTPLKIHKLLDVYYLNNPLLDNKLNINDYDYLLSKMPFIADNGILNNLRFDSNQIKKLVSSDANNQVLIKHLKDENLKLRTELDKLKRQGVLENQGYLDPENNNFSVEMKLCHDTWNHIYSKDNNSRSNHTNQVKKYLSHHPDYDISGNTIDRIVSVTKPKSTPAKSKPKKGF